MTVKTSLVIDTRNGEQIVRRPRATDVMSGILCQAFGDEQPMPRDLSRLLSSIDLRWSDYGQEQD